MRPSFCPRDERENADSTPEQSFGTEERETKEVDDQLRSLLVKAGVLPETMPESVTFNKVRGILKALADTDSEELSKAIRAVQGQKIRGPLASMIFIKHHLEGAHEAEVDRVDESEEGARLAILVYPEGEVPVRVEYLPEGINTGGKLSYEPSEERYY